jgi:hypothetical protein
MSKYYSETILSFSILIDGRRKRVVFSPLTNGGSVYITDNKAERAILEKLEGFGKTFVSMDKAGDAALPADEPNSAEKKDEPNSAAEKKPVAVEEHGVTTWQEAASYLVTNYGLKKAGLRTPDKILEAAAKVGVSFPCITVE